MSSDRFTSISGLLTARPERKAATIRRIDSGPSDSATDQQTEVKPSLPTRTIALRSFVGSYRRQPIPLAIALNTSICAIAVKRIHTHGINSICREFATSIIRKMVRRASWLQ